MIKENKKVFIGCSSKDTVNQKYFLLAKEVADIFSKNGYDLVFGASSVGMMGKCYQSFIEGKNDVYSHTVSKYIIDLENIMSKKTYVHDTTFERTKGLYEQADFILFLPGGTGTIAEIFSILEENRTSSSPKLVILYNYDGYYQKLIDLIDSCVEKGFNDRVIFSYFKIVNNIDELLNEVKKRI